MYYMSGLTEDLRRESCLFLLQAGTVIVFKRPESAK